MLFQKYYLPMSDMSQLFMNVSNVLRDESITNLLEENKILKTKNNDNLYGVKIKILEHTYDLGRFYQSEAYGCIIKLDQQNVICLIQSEDEIHIRPVLYKYIRICINNKNNNNNINFD